MSFFFIDRPVFAWVIAIAISLAGALAIFGLPIAQFPAIAPPSVTITATYPGASAKTLEDSVTQVIEQQMNGLDHLRYMSSNSDSSGTASVTLTFDQGVDPDIAQVQVQNKLQNAVPLLPQAVQTQGVKVAKSVRNFLMVVGLYSPNGTLTSIDLGDFAASTLKDEISRVDGVGDVQLFGSQYAMRIWLNPERLHSYGLTPADVKAALEAQNAEVSAGQVGAAPYIEGQQLNATVSAQSLLSTPEEFGDIIILARPNAASVRLSDVARVELGADSYGSHAFFNGSPAAGMAIRLASGANAIEVAQAVKDRIAQLAPLFPSDVAVVYPYDTTPFVEKSIEEVVKTLFEAIVLVFIVMFVFLQNWRATLIPTIAVPVVLLGTFGLLAVFGYSVNTLTMFGMVLAIGLLVDDAIVVVENVERVMRETGASPREATRQSMSQITGALIGIALVLSAVFVPMAMFQGSTGIIYRQFSVTIVSAMALSVLVALTLTPALCATLLKHEEPHAPHTLLGRFFAGFNKGFESLGQFYQRMVGHTLAPKRGARVIAIYAATLVAVGLLFMRLPTSFFPDEDQGYVMNLVQLPAGASEKRTEAVMKVVDDYYRKQESEAVNSTFYVIGFSFAGNGQNNAMMFVQLKPWDERGSGKNSAPAIVGRAFGAFSQIRDAMAFPILPPAVMELGTASGFDMQLLNIGGMDRDAFTNARNQLLGMAGQDETLRGVRPNGQQDAPQLHIDLDYLRLTSLGLSPAEANDALSSAWGGSYVNDFVDRGRIKRVYVQGDAPFRMSPEDLGRWYVRNAEGGMVPFTAFAQSSWTYASPRLERFNGVPSFNIQGQGAAGVSTGDAMAKMVDLTAQLPKGLGVAWSGLSFEEQAAGSQGPALYAISLIVVFLCLAALYESWTIPMAVLLVVPLGLFGTVLAANLRGLSNDIYFQVALLTTMGLAAKNAILIVEFARSLAEQGYSEAQAALEAARARLRPILMTSFAFIFGVLPLATATGAGSGGQTAVGTGVVGGMLAATIMVTLLTPYFFVLVRNWFAPKKKEPAAASHAEPAPGE